jgi:AraC-like DNA-binding protein
MKVFFHPGKAGLGQFPGNIDSASEIRDREGSDPARRVSEVVYESGFESIPHFNRVFKRYTGLPPTAYRAAQEDSQNKQ